MKLKYLVSDRAKAIVKLALNDLGTNSIADLFHVLYDLNRSIAWELNCLSSRLQKQIKMASLNQAQPEIIKQLEQKSKILQQSRLTYDTCPERISTCLHPFDINQNTPQTTEIVSIGLQETLETLSSVRNTHKLQDPRNGLRKLKNQISSLSAIVDIWWSWVDQCFSSHSGEPNVIDSL